MPNRQSLIATLQEYKARRDDVLFEDDSAFQHHLKRALDLLESDEVLKQFAESLPAIAEDETQSWWTAAQSDSPEFPEERSRDLGFRLRLAKDVSEHPQRIHHLLLRRSNRNHSDRVSFFRTVVLSPFFRALDQHVSEVAGYPSPEARALQAVPLDRIPKDTEVGIFLSHRSVDKPKVYRFFHTLESLGYSPWLDESAMPAGTNLERGILKGFQDSCAAVFFITENFKDERYLATEVDYAVRQKREKGDRFAIITLRFEGSAPVPDLLTPYTYKDVSNDLDAFRELVRALPIELGPVRWKVGIE